jgi:hypothetical protein
MRRWLLLIVVAPVVAGCGSTRTETPASAQSNAITSSAGPTATTVTTVKAATTPPSTPTSSTQPKSTKTGAGTPAATTPATVPTTTTPVNLPPAKKRKGPRSISVAEASHPITPSGGRSAAQQLVEAWKGRAISAADPNAVLVQRHLTSLTHKCTESGAVIAGYIRSGIQKYRRYGVIESPVEFSRALDSAVPPGRSNCKGILRTLLAQVEQG